MQIELTHPTRCLQVREAVYEGTFDEPKTDASVRLIPLPEIAVELLQTWQSQARGTAPEDLIFSTVSGKPISPNNVLRTWVWPACQAAELSRVTWLTFRRTYSSMGASKGRPAEGRRGDHGPHEDRYDAQRLHAGTRRRGA